MGAKSKEQDLVKRCIQGNAQAQRQLYQLLADKMFAVCLRYADSRQDAEDILQEAFIKVFKNIKRFKFHGSFEGWVRRIMVNTSIEHHRKSLKWKYAEDAQEVAIKDESINALEKLKVQDLLNLIAKLPPGYKTVFNLYVIEGYSHQEIADMLQISVSTSKSQLFKARAALQELLKQYKIERK